MVRAAWRHVLAARRAPQLDGIVPQRAAGQDRQGDRRGLEAGRLDDRLRLRAAQGVYHPHRPYGRSHHRRARGAAGPPERTVGVTHRVVVADRVAETGLKLLAATPDIEVVNCAGKPREELERALASAQALIVRSETRVTGDLLTRGPNLRVIARAGTGVDNIDVHAATRRGIAVMNAPGANTVSAAEHAMGLLLAQARHIPWAAEAMRRGEWDRKRFEGTELRGKTIGIVGLGRIGGHVAQLARAFGMQVVGHDPYLSPERAAELQLKLLPLEQLLRQADVVTLHVAHTEQTHHLINAARLKLMKPTAVLVNTARGELVDEAALADAVREKRIGGAAIDVFAVEPLPADAPLRKLERVILTPHLAASTAEAQERVSVEICGAVRDALLVGDLSFAINVPGISGELLRRLGPMLDLARRLGRLALALVDGPVSSVEVDYGGKDDAAPRPVLMAAVEGLLSAMSVEPVSLVNALLIAEERGIRHARRTGTPEPGFETTVGVTLEAARGRARVAGAVLGNGHGRVIRIDDYHVDVAPEGWMLVIRNRDVPGVIGRVGTLLGGAGINIGSYHQARVPFPGHDALAAITVDQPLTNGVLDELARVPDIQLVRLANFGD
ncbi:MAG: phosphoglycerate dehydrogenase [Gemmatimonadetes bacterium]|nr:MAG: phosphoglycerate dehydrogenase [Gemmatimonadota bacterium]TLY56749.1 MAG: phosphoglycerate dehydrogenase [Gemmatimonadota bacterium]